MASPRSQDSVSMVYANGMFTEWGGEAFYRLALTDWSHFTFPTIQVMDPAEGGGAFVNFGARWFVGF